MKIVVFNGPPRSGKDTAARALFETKEFSNRFRTFDRMSMPIKRAFAGAVGASIDKWGNVAPYESMKDEVIGMFGVSYRQWQIDFSERFMKPLYGEDIFARMFVARTRLIPTEAIILVPDCGFDIELKVLVEVFGPPNVILWRIHNTSATYAGDSRSDLNARINGILNENFWHTINHPGHEEKFKQNIINFAKDRL